MLYSEHLAFGKGGLAFKDKNGKSLTLIQGIKKVMRRLDSYLSDLDLLVVDFVGLLPFHSLRTGVYRVAGMKIGAGSHIHFGARFFEPNKISIGRGTIIGEKAFLDGRDKLTIGNHVDIASEVMIYNSEHDIHSEDFQATVAPVTIADYVFIGPRVTILPGVSIGRGVVVAAGAVVVKDVKEFEIVGGVPAKVIGLRRNKDPHYQLGRARLFQ